MLPPRRKKVRMGLRQSDRIECRAHLRWVKGFDCCAKGRGPWMCYGPIDPHHSKTRGAGGGDDTAVPLCREHHSMLDSPGWSQPRFEQEHRLNFAELSAELWQKSPHGIKYRREREAA